ncbi:hypothetical protein ACMHYB_35955 [Sorangium sp. So ce1128]
MADDKPDPKRKRGGYRAIDRPRRAASPHAARSVRRAHLIAQRAGFFYLRCAKHSFDQEDAM